MLIWSRNLTNGKVKTSMMQSLLTILMYRQELARNFLRLQAENGFTQHKRYNTQKQRSIPPKGIDLCFLYEYKFVVHNFCCTIPYAVHPPDPFRLAVGFQRFRNALCFCRLACRPKKHRRRGLPLKSLSQINDPYRRHSLQYP